MRGIRKRRAFLAPPVLAALLGLALEPRARAAPDIVSGPRTSSYGRPLPRGAVARLGRERSLPGPLQTMTFAPGSKVLAGMDSGGAIQLWDRATGKRLQRLEGTRTKAACLVFSPDGKRLAATGAEGVHVWDLATGRRRDFRSPHPPCIGVAFTDRGKTLLGVEESGIVRWDAASGMEQGRVRVQRLPREHLALAPDGRLLAVPGGLLDTRTGRQLHALGPRSDPACRMAFSPDGKLVFAVVPDAGTQKARTWQSTRGGMGGGESPPHSPPLRRGPSFNGICDFHEGHIAIGPGGKELAYTGYPISPENGGLQVMEVRSSDRALRSRRLWVPYHFRVPLQGLTFAPDGKGLVAWGADGFLVWEVGPDTLSWHEDFTPWNVRTVLFLPDGRTLVTVPGEDNVLRFWDTQTGKLVRKLRPQNRDIQQAALSPDGRVLAVSCIAYDPDRVIDLHDCPIYLLDVQTGRELGQLSGHSDPAQFLMFLADGQTLLSADQSQQLLLWDLKKRRLRRRLPATGYLATVSADGRRILHHGNLEESNKDARVHHISDGENNQQLSEEWDYLHSRFTPDGRLLAALRPGLEMLDLLDAKTGQRVRSFHRRARQCSFLAFSPDGRLLAWAEQGNALKRDPITLRLLDVRTGRERGRFQSDHTGIRDLVFTPDGKRLASVGAEGSILLWDVAAAVPPRPSAPRVRSRAELVKCWENLSGSKADAKVAEPLWQLVACQDQAVAFLRQQLHPVLQPRAGQIERLIRELDDDSYAVRQKATQELERLGGEADAALRKARAEHPSPEVRWRARHLLKKLDPSQPFQRKCLRALMVLEQVDTPAAQRLLHELAGGSPGAALTEAARQALGRDAGKGAAPAK